MTTESLMVHALKRGLLITDFHELSVGMILDYIARYDLLHGDKEAVEENVKSAIQNDFNSF